MTTSKKLMIHTKLPQLDQSSRGACYIEAYEAVGSTGTRALQLLEHPEVVQALKGNPEGPAKLSVSAVVADVELEAHGRFGRRWYSVPGGSLTMALTVLVPRYVVTNPNVHGWLAPLGCIALIRGINMALRDSNSAVPPLELKWPNDVYCQGMRIGSVNLDVRNVPGEPASVALVYSFGVNLTMRAEFLPVAQSTSLRLHAHQLPEFEELRDSIIAQTMLALSAQLTQMVEQPIAAAERLFAEANALLSIGGKWCTFHLETGSDVTGCVASLNEDASLTLLTDGGSVSLRTIDVGFVA